MSLCGGAHGSGSGPPAEGGGTLRFHRLRVLRRMPHPGRGFTQGLIVAEGTVWESTGGYGQSALHRYPFGAQQPDVSAPLPAGLFGEGICLAGAFLWQLTWRERVAVRWDARSLRLLGTIPFNREGWGICAADGSVLTSDGSSELVRRDPATLAPLEVIPVRLDGERVTDLNDVDWAAGRVWANQLGKRYLVGIDPGSGEVTDLVDAKAVQERHRGNPEAVLNGIAALPGAGEFLLTGKNWRSMYHVRLVEDRSRKHPARLVAG
jgi:glutaminyl-peptide cyclotransferase